MKPKYVTLQPSIDKIKLKNSCTRNCSQGTLKVRLLRFYSLPKKFSAIWLSRLYFYISIIARTVNNSAWRHY